MSATLVKITVVLSKGELSKYAADASHPVAPYRETSVVVTDSGGVAQKAVLLNGSEKPDAWTFDAWVPPAVVPVNLVHAVRPVPGVLATVVATDLDVAGNAIGEPVKYVLREGDVGGGGLPAFLPTIGITVTAAEPVAPAAPEAPVFNPGPPVVIVSEPTPNPPWSAAAEPVR
jgi:hypothetical protein